MERAFVKQRAGIVQKQVAAGREFKVSKQMASVGIRFVCVFFIVHIFHPCVLWFIAGLCILQQT